MTDITGVDFVAHPGQDHDKAAKFYGETLGAAVRQARGATCPRSEFQAGNLTLAVMQSDAFGFEFVAEQRDGRAAGRRRRRHAREARGAGHRVPRRDPRLRRLPPVVLRRPRRQPARPAPPLREGALATRMTIQNSTASDWPRLRQPATCARCRRPAPRRGAPPASGPRPGPARARWRRRRSRCPAVAVDRRAGLARRRGGRGRSAGRRRPAEQRHGVLEAVLGIVGPAPDPVERRAPRRAAGRRSSRPAPRSAAPASPARGRARRARPARSRSPSRPRGRRGRAG